MRSLVAATLALCLCAAAPAGSAPADPAFTADAFRAHVTFLSDDLLEGRDTGTRGYDIAARYVATRFAAIGLTPGVAGHWYQPIRFRQSVLADQPAPVLKIGDKAFVNGREVLHYPDAIVPNTPYSGEVVFAGFGIEAPHEGFDDYRGLDVRGKMVALLSGYPRGTPSELGASLAAEKGKVAARHGAIGTISIQTIAAAKTRPWARVLAFSGGPTLNWLEPDGRPYDGAPGLRLSVALDRPAAEALFAGAPRALTRVLAEADQTGGTPAGFALKQRVSIERATTSQEIRSENILGILPGSDPALANEYVVLMAHLDHEGIDERRADDKIMNGAMDNAAGIATMLEVARAMAASKVRPRRPILFAAVTGEEHGLLGSQYLARHPLPGGGKAVAVVNLDMPILLYDFTDVIAFGAQHSTLGPLVAKAAEGMGVALSPDPIPQEGIFTRSDHYRFVQQGVPSVFLMTGFANGGDKLFSDFLANHYHQPSDQIDLPFNWDAGAKFARINYRIARAIADADQAPRWYSDSVFGETYAPDALKAQRPTR